MIQETVGREILYRSLSIFPHTLGPIQAAPKAPSKPHSLSKLSQVSNKPPFCLPPPKKKICSSLPFAKAVHGIWRYDGVSIRFQEKK